MEDGLVEDGLVEDGLVEDGLVDDGLGRRWRMFLLYVGIYKYIQLLDDK